MFDDGRNTLRGQKGLCLRAKLKIKIKNLFLMLKIKSRADVMLLAHVEFLESVRRLGDFEIWKFLIEILQLLESRILINEKLNVSYVCGFS